MKKILYCIFILFSTTAIFSDELYYYDKLTYDNFLSWVQSIHIPGFELAQTETEGSKEIYNIEYIASFNNKQNEMIQIRIGSPNVFYQYEDLPTHEIVGPYSLSGYPAVFIYHQRLTKPKNLTYLLVQLEKLKATFSITALTTNRLTQEEMEKYFSYFNLSVIENSEFISWSNDIEIPARIPGMLSNFEEIENHNSGARKVYKVTFKKSNDFISSLKEFMKQKKGWLDLIRYKDITIICNTSKDIKELENLKDGQNIEFLYFIP